jgi:hypothetical protein
VLDLATLGYALWLRWKWLARTGLERLWVALPHKNDPIVHAMFEASTSVQVGNGCRVLFWRDRWLDGASIDLLAPDVVTSDSPPCNGMFSRHVQSLKLCTTTNGSETSPDRCPSLL